MDRFVFQTSQTQRDDSPQQNIIITNIWKTLKFNYGRIFKPKNLILFLISEQILLGSWSILDWLIFNEASLSIRKQRSDLYLISSLKLLNIKEKKYCYWKENYLFFLEKFNQNNSRKLERSALGFRNSKEGKEFQILHRKLSEYSGQLYEQYCLGNIVLFEAGVTENNSPVIYPIFHKGYRDKGSYKPPEKQGRNETDSSDPSEYQIDSKVGEIPSEDLKILEILGESELYFSLELE